MISEQCESSPLVGWYAGVGSRRAPPWVCLSLTDLALRLEHHRFGLRSGGAKGCDRAFETGATIKRIYRPIGSKLWNPNHLIIDNPDIVAQATVIARRHHAVFDKLPVYAQALMVRNIFQVLGEDLNTHSLWVLCWTPDGAETKTSSATGGTGQAIRVANEYGVPVFNIYHRDAVERLADFCRLNNYLKAS